MGKLILILGAARSGKSSYAENLVKEIGGDAVLYVATAEAKDMEMRTRIEKHQAKRPSSWQILEAPHHTAANIRKTRKDEVAILVDCLTLLVSNLLLTMLGQDEIPKDIDSIQEIVLTEVEALAQYARETNVTMIIVSNEVGMGLVPPNELGRVYRDILGRANQLLAQHADEVDFMVAGIPMRIK